MKNIYKKVHLFVISMVLIALPVFVFAQEAPSEEPVEEPQGVAGPEAGDVSEDLPDTAADPGIDAGEPEVMEVLPELLEAPESEEVKITPLSDANIPGITVNVEQLNWNTFKFRPSSQLGAQSYTYSWDFGDGEKSDQRIVEHSFSRPGTFHVSLKMDGADLKTQDAVAQVYIGFFYLANWRLWILLLLLTAIIIVASAVTGMANGKEKPAPKLTKVKPPEKEPTEEGGEIPLDTLSEETGDLDSMAATGLDTDELSDELALLESLDNTAEDISDASDEESGIGELLESVSEEVESKTKVDADAPVKDDPIVDLRIDEEKLDKGLDELLESIEEKPEVPEKPKKKIVKKKSKKKTKKSSKKRKAKKK